MSTPALTAAARLAAYDAARVERFGSSATSSHTLAVYRAAVLERFGITSPDGSEDVER